MHNLPFSPAAERNKAPILERLQAILPAQGTALEIASGTGQHAVWFAAGLPGWHWQPTDFEAQALPAPLGTGDAYYVSARAADGTETYDKRGNRSIASVEAAGLPALTAGTYVVVFTLADGFGHAGTKTFNIVVP